MSERQASLKVAGNPQFIRNIRKGASASPRGENILKLARVLQVSESWLLGTSDDLGDPPNVAAPFGVRFGGVAQASYSGIVSRHGGFQKTNNRRFVNIHRQNIYSEMSIVNC